MVVYQKDSTEHDHLMAELSHLPHLIASVLSHALQGNTKNARQLAGQGLEYDSRFCRKSKFMVFYPFGKQAKHN